MRTQNEDATPAKRRSPRLNDQIAFFLVDRVGQGMGLQRSLFGHGAGNVRTISRNTAWKNELPDTGARIAIGFGNSFHYASGAGNVDLPHLIDVQNTGALRIDDKRQMYDRHGLQLAQQQKQLARRIFLPEVEG